MTAETHPAPAWSAPRGVPVSILTGFLGAGKTTLLNRLIGDPWLSDAALIINEFGDVGIDHLLVESSGDGVIELSDGCLCCTVRGELVDTLSLAILDETGRKPELSTSGGTSDARFIKDYCEVVEFGLVGKTMHQVDERVSVEDIETLTRVYERFIAGYFASFG